MKKYIAIASDSANPGLLYLNRHGGGTELITFDVIDDLTLRILVSKGRYGANAHIYIFDLDNDKALVKHHSPMLGWLDYVPFWIVYEDGAKHPDVFKSRADAMAYTEAQPITFGSGVKISDSIPLVGTGKWLTVEMEGGQAVAWRIARGYQSDKPFKPYTWELWENTVSHF